jgi:hypothetical protein
MSREEAVGRLDLCKELWQDLCKKKDLEHIKTKIKDEICNLSELIHTLDKRTKEIYK